MEPSEALIIIFLMGLTVPLFSYHIFLLAKTARKINYYFAVYSILSSIYIVLFSGIPQTSLIGTPLFQILPILRFLTVLGMIYSYHGIIKYGCRVKMPLLINIYYGLITVGTFGWLLFIIARWNYPLPGANIPITLCAQILLLSFYVILLYSMINVSSNAKTQKDKKENFPLYIALTTILSFFLALSILSHLLPYLEMFRYFFIHIPVVLYIFSLYFFNHFVKYESLQDEEYEEERQNTIEKLLVKEEKAPPPASPSSPDNTTTDESEIKIDIAFSEELEKKIKNYNSIENAIPLSGNLQPDIFLHAKQSSFDHFVQALFTFIYNTKNSSEQYQIKMECGNENIFLSCGEFSLSSGDRSLNMEKVRLIQLKKSTEELGGSLSITKNQETGGMALRLKFSYKDEKELLSKEPLPFKDGLPTILLATDVPDSQHFFADILHERYNIIYAATPEECIVHLTNPQTNFLCLICAMSSDNRTQEVYYAVERQPSLSAVPLLLLVNEHQTYLDLKNYRQFPAIEKINPVETEAILGELEKLRQTVKQVSTRNIEAINNKIEAAQAEDASTKTKKKTPAMTQLQFDEKAARYQLSNNEKVITILLLRGLEYREIATKTKLSMDKLLAMTEAIYNKTGTHSKIELIDLFLQ